MYISNTKVVLNNVSITAYSKTILTVTSTYLINCDIVTKPNSYKEKGENSYMH